MSCPHCEFISDTFPEAKELSDREYWILTEIFTYLHDGDECNYSEPLTNESS